MNRRRTTNRSLRLETSLIEELQRQALERGQSANALAERLIAEGLRQGEHPLIAFRDGAGGRRAAIVGTRLDVWQVMDTVRASDNSIVAAAAYLDIPETWVQATVRYYAAYAQEVEEFGARAGALGTAAGRARVRLCLDEHYSPRIAAALRERGHDVIASQAEPALRGRADADLLEHCLMERRVLVTENVADFMPLVHARAARGDAHFGVVFTSASSMPRGAATIGRFVEALDRLLRELPGEDALRDQARWLAPSE